MYIDANIIRGKDTLFFLNYQRKMMFYFVLSSIYIIFASKL